MQQTNSGRNLSMMTDLYQLTMMNAYLRHGMGQNRAVFDLFFRENPNAGTYFVMAGLQQAIEYINNIHFSKDDIQYLRSLKQFDEDFLTYLSNFRFTGSIYAMPEGTMVFPTEPIVRVEAPIIEAQLIETALLNIINHQTLIATKASRVVQAAGETSVLEFGLRRAQGPDAGIYGARAAMIGGCDSTSNVMAGQLFGVPVKGTHAHSWVMSFQNEIDAFRAYAEVFPDNCLLLVDTYNTLNSGVPNAIKVFHELREKGYEPLGIRLDSGDLAYLSKQARIMLDEAGFPKAAICASGDIDEELIFDLKGQGAKIDIWGVGTKLITSDKFPALGGVYKLSAEEVDGVMVPRMKISDNIIKLTNPGIKKVVRLYSKKHGKAIADLITLIDEEIEEKPLRIYNPVETWKSMVVTGFYVRELMIEVFRDGEQVYTSPDVMAIREYCKREIETLWDEYKRQRNPHVYKVDLSDKLYDMKKAFLESSRTV
ncbi:MAG: nicotinate phosphoribosyltransferase [Christensenellales bacterium]|jgi:nicotinate phosphoribosyltransferase